MTDYLPLERAPAKQIADHAWNLNITEYDALEDVIVDTLPLKKIFRILIPFFTFSILKLVYSNCISNHFIHANGLREQIIDAFVYGNLYWFCYAIFLIFLLSPVLWTKHGTGITRISIYIVITFAVFSSVSQLLNLTFSNIFQIINAIYYFPFFAAGYYIYQHKTHFEETIQKNSIFLP